MLRIIPFILVLFLWPVAQTSMHSSIDRSRDVATKLSRPRSLFLVQVSSEAVSKRSDMRTNLLHLRGGESSFFKLIESIDAAGSRTFGNGLWAFIKSIVGLGKSRETRSVEEDLAAIQKQMQDRKGSADTSVSIQKQMEARKPKPGLKDRRLLYFIVQGPTYFLNPMVHLLRYVRSTEQQVRAAVVYLQDPPESVANRTFEQHLAALAAPPPGGFGRPAGALRRRGAH